MKIKGLHHFKDGPVLKMYATFHRILDLCWGGGLNGGGGEGVRSLDLCGGGGLNGGGWKGVRAGCNHIGIDCSLFSMSKEAICFNMKPNYYFARNNSHFLLRLKVALLTQIPSGFSRV